MLDGKTSTLDRHPKDGWTVAEPYPMGPATRAAFRGLIPVLCPPPPAPQLADLEDRIELHVRRIMRYFPPLVAIGFCLAIHLIDWSPIWRFVAFSRVRKLDRARAEAVLDGLGASRSPAIRTLILGVRGVVMSTYYDQDEVHAAIDYAPIPWLRSRIALRERIVAGGAETPEDRIGPHSDRVTP
jgi:hypothetical protein